MKSNTRRLSILDVPSNLGLKPPAEGREAGVKQMAAAIRSRGLLQRLAAVDAGTVEAPAYHHSLDVRLGIRNPEGLAIFAKALAVRIRELLERNRFPLVLGGDCSILLGSTLALRQLGRSQFTIRRSTLTGFAVTKSLRLWFWPLPKRKPKLPDLGRATTRPRQR